jgi:CelD/BcsL family acetyltransferase involved in cellulose biosynthesis/glycosyltransferase involved in cell wall biosynthesis
MGLSVLNIAYPFARVGPDAVGGAEQVLHLIDRALAEAGHHSVVIAPEGSSTAGDLVSAPVTGGPIDGAARKEAYARYRELIPKAIEQYSIDIVHLHGLDFINYLDDWRVPALATLHLPPESYDAHVFGLPPQLRLVCVSQSQRRRCPPAADLLVVENGVAVDELPLPAPRGNYALAMGRICPEKGFDMALDAAARAGVELLLAGEVFPYQAHQAHYRLQIVPRLDARRRFVGAIGLERKRAMLCSAHCLLAPSLVAETSSLAAMEALACATPVIAFPSGALAEIVEDGITGFLVSSVEEMAQAIAAVRRIDPAMCRARAQERFSARRMTGEYLKLYGQLSRTPTTAGPATPRNSRALSQISSAVLTTCSELEDLLPQWLRLWRDCGSTPFQSPHWLLLWWKHFGADGQLCMAVLRRYGELAAVLPFWLRGTEETGARELLLMGSGVSDSLDALYDPEARELCAAFASEHLAASAQRWAVCDLQELPAGSPLLDARLPRYPWSERSVQSVCPALKLEGDLARSIPAAMLRRWRYYQRRLQRSARIILENADRQNFEQCFTDLIALHQARWNARGQPGVLSDPAVAGFHREAARCLMQEGALRLYLLRVDGAPAASYYGFQWRGRAFYYLGGFDPRLSGLNPGTVLVGHAIEQAVAEGSREFCFLRGNEAYKYSWGARDGFTYRRIIRKASQADARGTPAYASGA